MPHPERCVEALIGGDDGRFVFQSLIDHVDAVAA
jgi:phosphoribosylformylglycinamidine synthase